MTAPVPWPVTLRALQAIPWGARRIRPAVLLTTALRPACGMDLIGATQPVVRRTDQEQTLCTTTLTTSTLDLPPTWPPAPSGTR